MSVKYVRENGNQGSREFASLYLRDLTWVDESLRDALLLVLLLDELVHGEVPVHLVPYDEQAAVLVPLLQHVDTVCRGLTAGQFVHLCGEKKP